MVNGYLCIHGYGCLLFCVWMFVEDLILVDDLNLIVCLW